MLLSLSALPYISFVVPASRAELSGDRLWRNNAHALLMGCHYVSTALRSEPGSRSEAWGALMRRQRAEHR